MRIGIDIDDTIADTNNYFYEMAIDFDKNVLHKNGIVDPTRDIPRCFDWNKDETKSFFDKVFNKEVLNIPLIPDSDKYLNLLKEKGVEIVIITGRNTEQMNNPYQETKLWLDKNNIPYDKLIVEARYKGPIVEQESIDLFIDDSIGQCSFIADNNKIDVIMKSSKINNVLYKGVTRLNSWKEIYDYIEDKYRGKYENN